MNWKKVHQFALAIMDGATKERLVKDHYFMDNDAEEAWAEANRDVVGSALLEMDDDGAGACTDTEFINALCERLKL